MLGISGFLCVDVTPVTPHARAHQERSQRGREGSLRFLHSYASSDVKIVFYVTLVFVCVSQVTRFSHGFRTGFAQLWHGFGTANVLVSV